MSAVFTPFEKGRIRYHLGYLGVQPAASLQFGIPRPIETIFLVETAMDKVIDDGFTPDKIRQLLGILDNVECLMQATLPNLQAMKMGQLELREDAEDAYEREYNRWAARLADILGVPLYPYAKRNRDAVDGVNIRVRG